jgi:thiosulfate dehydrogenase (quinone) large subunit
MKQSTRHLLERDAMKSDQNVKTPNWSSWAIVPLRLFLGITFIYAGIQKLTDPQYFDPAARGYIGRQITAFATGSPLHAFLTGVAAHAALFGGLVAYGELAIGLGALLGLFLRPASFFGFLINLVFFFSADWHIFPYFYGSDIVFLCCWITLFIAGPVQQVLPALDTWLVKQFVERAAPADQPRRAAICEWVFGVKVDLTSSPTLPPVLQGQRPQAAQQRQQPASRYKNWQLEQARQQGRRNFVWGTLSGGAAMLVLAWLVETLHLLPGSGTNASDLSSGAQVTPTTDSSLTGAGSTPTSSLPGGAIAKISDVQTNSSVNFTLPSTSPFNGDPGILIHLNNGQFVAYDATCTHAGCPVDYDPSSQQLVCPCHGAAFDPAHSASVLNGPAQTPLTSVPIKVDQQAGTISLS